MKKGGIVSDVREIFYEKSPREIDEAKNSLLEDCFSGLSAIHIFKLCYLAEGKPRPHYAEKNRKRRFHSECFPSTLATLFHTSDGIESARSVTIQCKSKRGIGSGVGRPTESESQESEEFLFLPIPLSLPSCRFTLDQIPTPRNIPLPSLPALV